MCFNEPDPPPPSPPPKPIPAPPPAPEEPPKAPVLNEEGASKLNERSSIVARRKGTSRLRIDRAQVPGQGTGLNIPS